MKPIDVGLSVPPGWAVITYAENQPEYIPLPTMKSVDGRVVSRWQLTPEEREMIAAGADIFLTLHTFNQRLQPIQMMVGGASVEPIAGHVSETPRPVPTPPAVDVVTKLGGEEVAREKFTRTKKES